MTKLTGTQTLMRIFIAEQDKYRHRPLSEQLLKVFREHKVAGATVLKGTAGFGAKSHIHSADLLAISENLPVVVEVVDTQEKIEAVLGVIDEMITDGLVTTEIVNVIRYKPTESL